MMSSDKKIVHTRGERHHADGHGIEITLATLQECFGMKRKDAAARLGIGETSLKRVCRSLGVTRWPKHVHVPNDDSLACSDDSAGPSSAQPASPKQQKRSSTHDDWLSGYQASGTGKGKGSGTGKGSGSQGQAKRARVGSSQPLSIDPDNRPIPAIIITGGYPAGDRHALPQVTPSLTTPAQAAPAASSLLLPPFSDEWLGTIQALPSPTSQASPLPQAPPPSPQAYPGSMPPSPTSPVTPESPAQAAQAAQATLASAVLQPLPTWPQSTSPTQPLGISSLPTSPVQTMQADAFIPTPASSLAWAPLPHLDDLSPGSGSALEGLFQSSPPQLLSRDPSYSWAEPALPPSLRADDGPLNSSDPLMDALTVHPLALHHVCLEDSMPAPDSFLQDF